MITLDWTNITTIAISVVALWHSIRTGSKQNKMEQRLVEIENARERDRVIESTTARIRAQIDRDEDGRYRLLLENEGQAAARELKVLLDGQPLSEHRLFLRNVTVVNMIGPGGHLRYPLGVASGPDSILVSISWTDDSERPGKWESQLNIYG